MPVMEASSILTNYTRLSKLIEEFKSFVSNADNDIASDFLYVCSFQH